MGYELNIGGKELVIPEYERNYETSLVLFGKNSLFYGEDFHSNIIHLLEHFSSPFPPNNPVIGQLWYDNKNKELKTYNDGWNSFPVSYLNIEGYTKKDNSIVDYLKINEPKTKLSVSTKKYVTDYEYTPELLEGNNILCYKFVNDYFIGYGTIENSDYILFPYQTRDMNYSIISSSLNENANIVYNKSVNGFNITHNSNYIVSGFLTNIPSILPVKKYIGLVHISNDIPVPFVKEDLGDILSPEAKITGKISELSPNTVKETTPGTGPGTLDSIYIGSGIKVTISNGNKTIVIPELTAIMNGQYWYTGYSSIRESNPDLTWISHEDFQTQLGVTGPMSNWVDFIMTIEKA